MSRYDNTSRNAIDMSSRYSNRSGRVSKYNTTIYKQVEERNSDIYVTTQSGDRLDLLAEKYYGDSSLWWFIGRVNNISTLNLEGGLLLRIPASAVDASNE